jgi:hypothetical protein
MPQVTRVITGLIVITLSLGCAKETPKSKPDFSKLPSKIDIPPSGKAGFISPKDLIDKINSGQNLDIFFFQEAPPENPDHIVAIPGMKMITLGDIYNLAPTIPKDHPLYFVCLYGDDSRRMSGEIIKEGHDCYYLDGGSYRLYNEMKKNGWSFRTR